MTDLVLTFKNRLNDLPVADRGLVLSVLTLISLGLIMVASASVDFAEHVYGDGYYFLRRHLFYLLLGIVVAAAIFRTPPQVFFRYRRLLLLSSFVLLALVLVPGVGRQINGSQRWLGFGSLTLQVSEVVKVATILSMAGYLERNQRILRADWREVGKPVAALVGLMGLLLLEPDYGSSVVLAGTVLGMLFIAGVKLWQFSLLLGLGIGGLGFLAITSPYRLQRLITFLDPWADQYDSGYQLTQSLIAFGRGEWFGVGLGNSVQKLFYLPEAHTDFVFAIFGEEFGLLGVLFVIGLYALVVCRVFIIARRAVHRQEWFCAYTAFGVGMLFAGQSFINIGVTSGLLPTKGLTLPFISYGGSSLLVSCALMALVLRIAHDQDNDAHVPGRVKRER